MNADCDPVDEKERSKGEILSDYYECLIRQVRGSPSIDPPVPNRPIRAGDGSPIRGGHLRFQQNWRDLQAFQLTFLAWFKQRRRGPGKPTLV